MKVGIVGCGFICHRHLEALRRLRNVEVVGVCDRDEERASAVAKAHGVRAIFGDIERLLAAASPEVVHILTPPQSHRELAIKSLDAGCHVIVEKPMAMDASEAKTMVEAARRRERKLGVCHNFRFVSAYLEAHRLVQQGALGNVLSADVFWRMSSYEPSIRADAMDWMQHLRGGMFQEVLPHLIYTLAALMGELKLVSVVTGGDRRQTELRALFSSERGPATIALSLQSTPVQKFMRIYGSDMSLHIDLATSVLLRMRRRSDGVVGRTLTNVDQSVQLTAWTVANAARRA